MTKQIKTLTIKNSTGLDVSAEIDHINKVIRFKDSSCDVVIISFEEWCCIKSFIDNEVNT